MRLFQPDSRQRRTMGALFAISFVLSVLLTAFYNTQIVSGADYRIAAEGNRLRPVVIPAPRGTIYDRYGRVIAASVPAYTVAVTRQDFDPYRSQTLPLLATILGVDTSGDPLLNIDPEGHEMLSVEDCSVDAYGDGGGTG